MGRSAILRSTLLLPLWLAGGCAFAQPVATIIGPPAVDANPAPFATLLPGSAPVSSPEAYERLIADLQSRQGATDGELALSEAYAGLGNSLQALEQHADALAAYEQAMQLLRESKGIHAVEQLPLLRARLVSGEALAAWEEVDDGRFLAYRIALMNPAAGVALRYQTVREFGLWRLRAADEDLIPDALHGAEEAAELYREELARPGMQADYRGNAISLANLYLDLAALEFLQARKKLALPLSAYVEGGQRTVTEMYCETIPTPDGRGRQVCRNMQVPNMDYFLSLSDRKYRATWDHLDAMQDAVLEAYELLLPEVDAPRRDDALKLLTEVHSLTRAFNDFVARNARRTGSRIAAPSGSRINR